MREQLERGGGTASSCAILNQTHGHSRQASPLILKHPLDALTYPLRAFHAPCEVRDRDLQRTRESGQHPPRRVTPSSLDARQIRRMDVRRQRERFDRYFPFTTQLTDRPTKITVRPRASGPTIGCTRGPQSSVTRRTARTCRAVLPLAPHHAYPRSIASRRACATAMKSRNVSTCSIAAPCSAERVVPDCSAGVRAASLASAWRSPTRPAASSSTPDHPAVDRHARSPGERSPSTRSPPAARTSPPDRSWERRTTPGASCDPWRTPPR